MKTNKIPKDDVATNYSAATNNSSLNEQKSFQPKNKSSFLLIVFSLYAIIYIVSWRLKLPIGTFDLSILLLIVAFYFRLANNKLSDGKPDKKYDYQTRKIALLIIYFVILVTVVPFLLFVFAGA